MTHLDHIAEILSEIELPDDTAIKLHDHMTRFANSPTGRSLIPHPGFFKLWDGLAEAVDRNGGFEPQGRNPQVAEPLRSVVNDFSRGVCQHRDDGRGRCIDCDQFL